MSKNTTSTTYKEFFEQSRERRIKELEKALKDDKNGNPTCRAIAKQTIAILKNNDFKQIEEVLGRDF